MKYRRIRRSDDILVSEIALGCEGFTNKNAEETAAMLEAAMDLGINFMDLYSSNPNVRSNIGKALRGRRNKMVIQGHIGSVWENGEYLRTRELDKVKAALEDQLARLETEFLDIGMIHYVDGARDFDTVFGGELIAYCQELKKSGRIRCLGISSHNPAIAAKAVNTGLIDVLMFSVNPAYDMQPPSEDCNELWNPDNYKEGGGGMDPERRALYELCENKQVAIDVMKAFGGGDMLSSELSPFGVAFHEYQCLEYCLTRPAVVSVMAGCHSIEQMEKLAGYYSAAREEKDYADLLAGVDKFKLRGNCMYCGHCVPCSVGINVADVNKYLNLALAQGEAPETVANHYRLLSHHASECVGCGYCEENCPFGVEVIRRMEQAAKVFGY